VRNKQQAALALEQSKMAKRAEYISQNLWPRSNSLTNESIETAWSAVLLKKKIGLLRQPNCARSEIVKTWN